MLNILWQIFIHKLFYIRTNVPKKKKCFSKIKKFVKKKNSNYLIWQVLTYEKNLRRQLLCHNSNDLSKKKLQF